jgi:acetyl-CoA carboxylase biotin carboxyl carrier protein
MDLRKLKTLIDLVSDSNIAELEITEAEGKVRIVKSSGAPVTAAQHAAAAMMLAQAAEAPGAAAAAQLAATAAAAPAVPTAAAAPVAEALAIKSPMVGTFYRSANPGSKAFVDVGDEVKKGQPVCIIEAMKIMNEIEADCGGRVVRIACENGQAVEFGQPLFIIE